MPPRPPSRHREQRAHHERQRARERPQPPAPDRLLRRRARASTVEQDRRRGDQQRADQQAAAPTRARSGGPNTRPVCRRRFDVGRHVERIDRAERGLADTFHPFLRSPPPGSRTAFARDLHEHGRQSPRHRAHPARPGRARTRGARAGRSCWESPDRCLFPAGSRCRPCAAARSGARAVAVGVRHDDRRARRVWRRHRRARSPRRPVRTPPARRRTARPPRRRRSRRWSTRARSCAGSRARRTPARARSARRSRTAAPANHARRRRDGRGSRSGSRPVLPGRCAITVCRVRSPSIVCARTCRTRTENPPPGRPPEPFDRVRDPLRRALRRRRCPGGAGGIRRPAASLRRAPAGRRTRRGRASSSAAPGGRSARTRRSPARAGTGRMPHGRGVR